MHLHEQNNKPDHWYWCFKDFILRINFDGSLEISTLYGLTLEGDIKILRMKHLSEEMSHSKMSFKTGEEIDINM